MKQKRIWPHRETKKHPEAKTKAENSSPLSDWETKKH